MTCKDLDVIARPRLSRRTAMIHGHRKDPRDVPRKVVRKQGRSKPAKTKQPFQPPKIYSHAGGLWFQ